MAACAVRNTEIFELTVEPRPWHRVNPWVGKIPWRKKWQPTPVFLTGKCHGQRSLTGHSPWVA